MRAQHTSRLAGPSLLLILMASCAMSSFAAADSPSSASGGTSAHAPSGTASAASTTSAAAAPLSYAALMKLSPDERKERIEKLPSEEQSKFLFSISDMQRAVLLVDPDDCGGWARIKRRGLATGEKADGIGGQLVKDGQSAVTRGVLSFIPGGGLLRGLAQGNETRKAVEKQTSYVDVCDLPADERAVLVTPTDTAAAQQTPRETKGFWDKASEIVAR